MKKKNIIRMLLMSFGYDKNIEIETHWTGTCDGQFQNSLAYEVKAENDNGEWIHSSESCFQELIHELFMKLTRTDQNDRLIHWIMREEWNTLN